MCDINEKPTVQIPIGIMESDYVLLMPNNRVVKWTDSFIDVVREIVTCGKKIDEILIEFTTVKIEQQKENCIE